MFGLARQPDEHSISSFTDEDPLDAYSRAVSAVVERGWRRSSASKALPTDDGEVASAPV
jgi:hypothetical protein